MYYPAIIVCDIWLWFMEVSIAIWEHILWFAVKLLQLTSENNVNMLLDWAVPCICLLQVNCLLQFLTKYLGSSPGNSKTCTCRSISLTLFISHLAVSWSWMCQLYRPDPQCFHSQTWIRSLTYKLIICNCVQELVAWWHQPLLISLFWTWLYSGPDSALLPVDIFDLDSSCSSL